ncbi:MAG: ROK family transcriptional regulator [Deltaproteobacteria bacterium]|nr:ROK family transcriptional regulator [Deltaproteobacteria bacterium]
MKEFFQLPDPAGAAAAGKVNAAQVRAQNERLLLNLVWRERNISRAELARRTELSRSTVSAIVADLMDTGLIGFRGAGESLGGRRPVMLGFEDDALGVVGVEMGSSHVGVVVMNLRGEPKSWRSRAHDVRDDPDGTLALMVELIREGLAEAGLAPERLAGVGVGVPSPVDPARPEVLSGLVLPKWVGYDIPARLEEAFGRRVVVDNDANLGALAELWWGAGTKVRDLAFVKVGTGIGCGHIIRGEIYRGASGVAGEIGHVVVDPQGPACMCGLNGCLATLVGARALAERARAGIASGRTPTGLDAGDVSVARIVAAAEGGDALARELIEEAGRHLGIAIAGLVNLTNPATVVLGGGLVRAGEALLAPLRATLEKRTLWLALDDTEVVVSELGEREVAIGAATCVLEAALADPSLFPRLEGAQAATG